ncbi:protein FAM204A [Pseudophryne corroboree]|uniref:protein FAM204A n=1 Tax=Pseudophryne corroboree TaxID=495146 RepID=UPI003081608F
MWSGLMPAGARESDLSEEEEEAGVAGQEEEEAGVAESCVTKFLDLQKKRRELQAECARRERRTRRRRGKCKRRQSEDLKRDHSPGPDKMSPLDTLQKYFGNNDHLEPPVCQKILKKSRLEDSLDQALQNGDIEVAEQLSDRLATREIAVKITKAASCHRYVTAKEEQESGQANEKRQKPMVWGFEAKKRWETKSNMGYM